MKFAFYFSVADEFIFIIFILLLQKGYPLKNKTKQNKQKQKQKQKTENKKQNIEKKKKPKPKKKKKNLPNKQTNKPFKELSPNSNEIRNLTLVSNPQIVKRVAGCNFLTITVMYIQVSILK